MSAKNPLQRLHDYGQSFWWDTLSRGEIEDGTVERMRDENGMRGITSNPTIFHKAVSKGSDYDDSVRELVGVGVEGEEIFWRLAFQDIRRACEIMRPVYEASGGADGFVSLEVDPRLAFETTKSLEEARRLWKAVDAPNLMIKIPGSPEGIPAIRQALVDGLNVNVTLLFSQQAHIEVMNAYLDALESRLEQGESVDDMASVASFFVSRVDTLVDEKLDEIGTRDAAELRGKIAVANARLAYRNFQRVFSGGRWESLKAKGARVQRPLWASTSVKDERYPDVMYVEALVGRDTVNTMPTETLEAYLDHGEPGPDRVQQDVGEASAQLERLQQVGISMDEVTDQLLREGVQKFEKSFADLLDAVQEKAEKVGSGS